MILYWLECCARDWKVAGCTPCPTTSESRQLFTLAQWTVTVWTADSSDTCHVQCSSSPGQTAYSPLCCLG